jgi:hypothetical protein
MQLLSSLAQHLLNELNTISHVHDPAFGALTLSEDPAVSATRRQAYSEVYNYLTSND